MTLPVLSSMAESSCRLLQTYLDLANAVQKQTENNPFLIDHQQKPKPALQVPSRGTAAEVEVSKAFKLFDIHQSSHHLYIGKIDLHLFDDSTSEVLPENWNTDNGAIQATLYKLRVDFYPSHQVFSDGQFSERLQWVRYHSPNSCTELATKQLEQHLKVLSSKLELGRRDRFLRLWPQLNSQNVVIRVEDVVIQCVSEQTTKKESLLNMFVQDKQAKNSLPQNVSFFHMEFTTYFFPASSEYEVPPDSTHMVVGPFEFLVDHRSIRWMVYVFENILNAFEAPQVIILLAPSESLVDSRLPIRFLVNLSTIRVSNFILLDDPAVLLPILFRNIDNQSLEFVEKLESSLLNAGVHDKLLQLSQADHKDEGVFKPCSKHNQWFLSIPSFWLSCDFGKSRGGEIGLVNDISLAGCIVQHSDHVAIMLEPQSQVGVTLDHFQFVQLLQVQTKMVALLDQIDLDRQFFAKNLTHLPEKTPWPCFV
uniref:Uncharacterized protein n=1 Tax=Ditylenchus dipsaci TaxID=166011 RepID=A0A915EER1_9BILA